MLTKIQLQPERTSSGPRKCCFAPCHLRRVTVTALPFLKQQELKTLFAESQKVMEYPRLQISPVLEREAFLGFGCSDFTPSQSHAGFFPTSLYCRCTDSVGPVVSSVPLSPCFNAATTPRPQDLLMQAWARARFVAFFFSFLCYSTSSCVL